jgi:hypothetical protein
MEECIFVSVYPNTEGKIQILKECIYSLKKTKFPIVLVSNMDLPIEVSSLADDFLIGKNTECRYQDFFTLDEIDKARNSCRYLLHFNPTAGDVISYNPFFYGRGSTYHWSALTQHNLILKYLEGKNISRFFSIEGDTIPSESDLYLIEKNFTGMKEEDLDFIIPIQPNLGHIGSPFFLSVDYWRKVCFGFSKEDFLRTTYPSWSAEGYILERMKISGGMGKILIWNLDSFVPENCPMEWIIEKKEIIPGEKFPTSTNLLFPGTKKTDLSSSTDKKDQSPLDPLQYVNVGIGKILNSPVFFIWNRYNGETVKEIKAKISVFNGGIQIFNSEYNLFPSGWAWSPIFNLKRDSHCTVEIVVVGVNGVEFQFSDRFGSVGDSINMRDVIPE